MVRTFGIGTRPTTANLAYSPCYAFVGWKNKVSRYSVDRQPMKHNAKAIPSAKHSQIEKQSNNELMLTLPNYG